MPEDESAEPDAPAPQPDPGVVEVPAISGAPAVVAVVVTRNPGEWFEDALRSLEDQDYEELSVLVVDNGSLDDPTPRVAEVAPGAFVKRLKADEGFSHAANEALRSVEGAPFLLFCHDDVRLAPDVVTQMVAEAFRSNAGIVGAKLVEWDDPNVLQSVGYGVDIYGAAGPLVDPGELDQEQHDIARNLFAVSDACMLVRSDLFQTIGGFRERIPFFGEDIDLCWRTQVAGASVQFCPRAVVGHRGGFDSRRPTQVRGRMAVRHQTRSMLTNYEARRLVRLVPAGIVLSLVELIGSLFTGRASHSADILAAWAWGLTHPLEVHRDRRSVKRYRRVRDVEYLPLMMRGSTRLRALFRQDDGEHRLAAVTRTGRERLRSATASDSRLGAGVAVIVPIIVVLGARSVWFGVLPSMREFTDAGHSVGALLAEWFSGWRASGLGESAVPPGAVPGLGVMGGVLVASAGAARRVLVLAPILLGALGAWRLFGGTRSVRTRSAAIAAYALSPIVLNAFGEARLQALVAYAAAPWILLRLARHGGVAPLAGDQVTSVGRPGAPAGSRKPAPRLAATVLLVGLVAAISPIAAVVATVSALIVMVGPSLSGQARPVARSWGVGLLGLLGAALLNAPWLVAAVRHGDLASLTGLWEGRVAAPSAAQMLTGSVGDLRMGWWGWGFVLAAAVPLATGRSWRFGWALGGWLSIVLGLATGVVASRADFISGAGVELLLIPTVLGLAVAVAMVPAAFEADVVRADFGFPQLASFVAVGALGLAAVPVLMASFDGRWYLPEGDFGPSLDVVDDGTDFRTLWIGDPDVLPMSGWPLDGVEGVDFGLAEGMTPVMSQRWRLSGGAPGEAVAAALDAAVEGRTVHLGEALAPMSIRYVVVVDRPAPQPFAQAEVPLPAGVVDAFEEQLDLLRIPIGPGVDLFRVEGPWPPRGELGEGPAPASGLGLVGSLAGIDREVPEPVLGSGFGTAFDGRVGGDTVTQSVTGDPGWELEVDGRVAQRSDLFGWGQQFRVARGGEAKLSWSTPTSSRALQAAQLVLLLALVVLAMRRGSMPVPAPRRRVSAPAAPLVKLEGEEPLEDWRIRHYGAEEPDDPDRDDSEGPDGSEGSKGSEGSEGSDAPDAPDGDVDDDAEEDR
jgi:GT2 family glycosyltransferase